MDTLNQSYCRKTRCLVLAIFFLDFVLKTTLGTGSRKTFCTFSLKIEALKPRKGRIYIVPSSVSSLIHKWLPGHLLGCILSIASDFP